MAICTSDKEALGLAPKATPAAHLKAGRFELVTPGGLVDKPKNIPFEIAEDDQVDIGRLDFLRGLIFGRISGSMGVTSALLILIGGIYLFWTKTASRATILSLIISYAFLSQVLNWCGVEPVPGAVTALLGGGFLFGAFFMATDPVSSPRTYEARIMYGILIAVCAVVIRNFSIFNGGLMFSILLGNMFAPILDVAVKSYKEKQKAKLNAKEAAA